MQEKYYITSFVLHCALIPLSGGVAQNSVSCLCARCVKDCQYKFNVPYTPLAVS
jgi:hypothetical protein